LEQGVCPRRGSLAEFVQLPRFEQREASGTRQFLAGHYRHIGLHRPNQRDDPADRRPTQKEIQQQDRRGIPLVARKGDDGWQEVEHESEAKQWEEKQSEEVHSLTSSQRSGSPRKPTIKNTLSEAIWFPRSGFAVIGRSVSARKTIHHEGHEGARGFCNPAVFSAGSRILRPCRRITSLDSRPHHS